MTVLSPVRGLFQYRAILRRVNAFGRLWPGGEAKGGVGFIDGMDWSILSSHRSGEIPADSRKRSVIWS